MYKVSVIIPTYGEPKYLKDAIDSVIKQTLKEWQLIVVDDNNPETQYRYSTENILNKYKNYNNIIYIKHERNMNGAVARNTGLEFVDSTYVAFLDSDDEYLNTRLEECCKVMENNKNNRIAGVYTGCEFRRKGKKYLEYTNVESGNHLINVLACNFMFCTGSNIFMKTDVIKELNGFDESFIRHQDYEFLARYFKKYDLLAINKVLVIKNNDNVNAPNVEKEIMVKKHYVKKFESIINELDSEDKNYIYHSQCIQIAESAINEKNYDLSKECYKVAKSYANITLKENLRRCLLLLRNFLNS